MKRILMPVYGSYGDLHPFLGMARVLIARGHRVTIATHEPYAHFVRRQGAEFRELPPRLADIGPEEQWIEQVNHPVKGSEFVFRRVILPFVPQAFEAIAPVVAESDLVINHMLAYGASLAAEKHGVPWVSVALQPSVFFSVHDPPRLAPLGAANALRALGPVYLRLLYGLIYRRSLSWAEPLVQLRRKLGLPPATVHPLFEGMHSPRGTLALFSPAFAAPQADWPPRTLPIGFPFFDEEESAELSPATRAFLESGDAPVVFTLGSSVVKTRSPFFAIALDALEGLGRRAIFLAGPNPSSVPERARADARIHVAGYEPFSPLFPAAAAIVHQCGIGTTAQALRSGRPQVCVPFGHDQPDNAERVARLGAGTVLPIARLSTRRLCRALERALSDADTARAGAAIATRVRADDFAANLLRALRQLGAL